MKSFFQKFLASIANIYSFGAPAVAFLIFWLDQVNSEKEGVEASPIPLVVLIVILVVVIGSAAWDAIKKK